jgi:hypothetical protein
LISSFFRHFLWTVDRGLWTSLPVLVFLCLINHTASSQNTTVEGYVKEENTGNAIVFAHIFFKGTQVGTRTDTTGHFKIQISNKDKKMDSLVFTYLAYHSQTIAVKPGVAQQVTISMRPQFTHLKEVVVNYDNNPAFPILDRVLAEKKNNNPDNRASYTCEEYAKIRFDLNHLTDKLKKNVLFRPFDWIWDNADTTADGVSYLPVLLVEKQIDHYYQRSPAQKRDVLKGVNSTGLEGPKIMQFVEDLYVAPNIYDNFVVILDKSFPSPIHDNYKNHYGYFLEDSVMEGSDKVYIISFYPKFKRQLAFTGEMKIDAATSAIRQVDVRFDIFANVNFVRSYWVSQKYARADGTHWMPQASQVLGDFTVAENSQDFTGFFGRKTSTFTHYTIDQPINKKQFQGTELVVEADSARTRNDIYWQQNRHTGLTTEEQGVFNMVEKLEKDPAFIIRKNIVLAVVTGYVPWKQIEIGNFYTFYSYNKVEHSRLKFGFRANQKTQKALNYSAYGAYGTYDKKWKYGGTLSYNLTAHKRRPNRIGASYQYDIRQLSRSPNNIEIDNIIASLVQYSGTSSRNYVTDYNFYAESSPVGNVMVRVNYFNNTISPTGTNQFLQVTDGVTQVAPEYHAAGLDVTLRYSWQNPDITGEFYNVEKKNHFRKYPDITFQWKMGDKEIFKSDFHFRKVNIQLRQNVRLNKLGYTRYYIEAGKTFGTVPYPYLNIPFANQLVFHDDYAFNLMNFLEYVSDQYVTATVHHHFNGLIFDRIPGLNKLKWRSLVFARAWWGGIRPENNQQEFLFAENLRALDKGYYEAGFGIENIFKIARIDFTWRLTDRDAPGVYNFIVKPSFRFQF